MRCPDRSEKRRHEVASDEASEQSQSVISLIGPESSNSSRIGQYVRTGGEGRASESFVRTRGAISYLFSEIIHKGSPNFCRADTSEGEQVDLEVVR
jgi:hypothetical protein